MAITAQCDACLKKYNVGDAMAGKKVRCKHCGHIFSVPALIAAPDEPDLSDFDAEEGSADQPITSPQAPPPVVTVEGAGDVDSKSAARVPIGRAIPKRPLGEPIIEREEDDPDASAAEAESIDAPARPANPAFRFPASELLDAALPYALALLSIGWLIARATDGEDLHTPLADHAWLAHLRWLTVLFIYTILIFPITLAGVHRTGLKLNFGMPTAHHWKIFSVFALPFSLGAILSMVSGSPMLFVAGVGVGLFAALGAFWFLFRLNPRQTTGGLVAVGSYYLVAVMLAVGLLVGVNAALFSILKSSNSAATYPNSPLGPAFAWDVPPPAAPAPPPRKIVSAATEAATEPTSTPPAPNPTDPATPLVGATMESPLKSFETAVFPGFGDASLVLIVRSHNSTTDFLELWSAPSLVRQSEFQPQHPADTRSPYVLSPRGSIARLIEFPQLAVEIRSPDGTPQRPIELEAARFRNAEIISFAAENQLILLRESGGNAALELIDTESGKINRTIDLTGFLRSSANIALSPDGRLIAIALKSSAGPALQLFDIGKPPAREIVEQIPLALDLEKPVALSGVAFSPDSQRVAILYEEKGNRLVRSWQVADGKQLAERISFGPAQEKLPEYRGRALDWLPDGAAWLIYGRAVVDAQNGKDLGIFDLADVRGHHFLDRDTIAILGTSDAGATRLSTAELNLAKLQMLERPATRPSTSQNVFNATE